MRFSPEFLDARLVRRDGPGAFFTYRTPYFLIALAASNGDLWSSVASRPLFHVFFIFYFPRS